MSTSQFAVYQLKKKPELRNLLFRTYEELAQDQIPVQVANYEQVYLGTMKPGETPEQIKKDLEKKQPHNYKGHAVSTSDVLILNDNGATTTYYVNKDTFIEIPDFMKVTSSESGGLTKDTVGYEIEGKDGTWEVIDYLLVEGKNYFLMEHEQYGKDVAYVVLDQKGNVLVDSTYNGFDDVVKQKILDSLHPPVQEQTEGYKPKLDNWQKYMENGEYLRSAEITEEAAQFIAQMAGGDARRALNAVELGILTTEPDENGRTLIDLAAAEECIQRKAVNYDRDGDNHYDTISAFIKSMRGTDPDAAVFYLARMLDAGEDPKFIARRIMICASEDVGNADPQALVVAVAASQGVERIGMPEARILLSQAAAYVASAPKSNACIMAVDKALSMVRSQNTGQVPPYLRDAHYGGAKKLGHGIGYKYAHDYPENYVKQQYLPDEVKEERFYIPTENGYENHIKEHLKHLREDR